MEITLLNRQRGWRIDREAILTFMQRLIAEVPSDADDLGVCLVSDRRMRQANRRYRGRDSTTDVLSFPDAAVGPDGRRHLGDILVSVETAARQAGEVGASLDEELLTLLTHGYLHLVGYDHENDDGAMMRLQGRLLRRLLDNGRNRPSRA